MGRPVLAAAALEAAGQEGVLTVSTHLVSLLMPTTSPIPSRTWLPSMYPCAGDGQRGSYRGDPGVGEGTVGDDLDGRAAVGGDGDDASDGREEEEDGLGGDHFEVAKGNL